MLRFIAACTDLRSRACLPPPPRTPVEISRNLHPPRLYSISCGWLKRIQPYKGGGGHPPPDKGVLIGQPRSSNRLLVKGQAPRNKTCQIQHPKGRLGARDGYWLMVGKQGGGRECLHKRSHRTHACHALRSSTAQATACGCRRSALWPRSKIRQQRTRTFLPCVEPVLHAESS